MDKQKIREHLIKAKFYRFFAYVFAGCGFVMFLAIYIVGMEGDLMRVVDNPVMLVMLIVPLLPAVVLSMKATKAEKAVSDAVGTGKEESSKEGS